MICAASVRVLGRPIVPGLVTTEVPDEAWIELEACPLCDNERWVDVVRVESDRPAGVFAVCLACRAGFARRRPTESWIDAFYRSEWDRAGRDAPQVAVAPRGRELAFCRNHLRPGSRVLDVGAGDGSALLAFRDEGHQVLGLEASRHRARRLEAAVDVPCLHGPVESAQLPEGLNLVNLTHVLEHLYRPRRAIAHLAGGLAEGSHVSIGVPALWQEHPPQAAHFLPHLSWLTQDALRRLLADNRLRVVREESGLDLRVLARKEAKPVAVNAPAEEPEVFVGRVARWLSDGFGGGAGTFRLVWARDPSRRRWWSSRAWRGVAGDALWTLVAATRAIPGGRGRRLLPSDLRGPRVRSLRVRATNGCRLPLVITHERPSSTVWIK